MNYLPLWPHVRKPPPPYQSPLIVLAREMMKNATESRDKKVAPTTNALQGKTEPMQDHFCYGVHRNYPFTAARPSNDNAVQLHFLGDFMTPTTRGRKAFFDGGLLNTPCALLVRQKNARPSNWLPPKWHGWGSLRQSLLPAASRKKHK